MTAITRKSAEPQHPSAIVDTSVWNGTGFSDHQDVLLQGGEVVDVRPHSPELAVTAARGVRIDGRGAHVLPGFVNTHTHLQQATCRGIGDGQPLLPWLLTIGESMASITPDRAYLATVAGALEGLLSGTTTLVEHMWPHPSGEVHDAVVRGLRDVGVRAVLGRGVADRADSTRAWGFDPRLMQPLEDAFADIERLQRSTAGTRISLGLAVPNPRSVTPAGMRAIRRFADARGLPVMMHLLETATDDLQCRTHAGVDAVDYLADADFLWDGLLAVHCVEISDAAISRFAAHGTTVSWNPVSNLRLGSGIAPVLALRAAGVRVGIGVDGAGSNDRQDMFETIRTGAYTQRAALRQADAINMTDMMQMATAGLGQEWGARTAVVAGAPADLTIIRFDRDFACLPVTDAAASVLTTGTPRIVDSVLVGGEIVVSDGMSTRIDHTALTRALVDLPSLVPQT